MNTLTLYRIEHRKTRRGPFCDGGPAICMDAVRMPGPRTDLCGGSWEAYTALSKYLEQTKAIFAFASRQAMLRWFTPKDLAQLQADGYRVVKLRVPRERVRYMSEHQAIVPTTIT